MFHTQVEQGLALVDEATLAAVGGELSPYVAGNIYCLTIGICRSVADYRRASEWTEAAARWCERESITAFPGVCRVQRAEILRLRGSYDAAEDEAGKARTELEAFGRLPQAGAGANEVGEVRLRRGDLDGAEEAFAQAHRLGNEPQPGMALLRLARGQVDAARSSIGTALADAGDPFDRARLLPARVEIALAAYDVTEAREAAEELGRTAEAIGAPMLQAAAHQALGATLTYEEDAAAAIAELRKAVRAWTEADAPFEAAQARRWLAVAYRAGGDEASAVLELGSAKAAFEGLGAIRDAERCEEMIRAGDAGDAGRRVVRTFMFTDIVGSTDLVRTIGDEAWEGILRWHDETLRTQIGSHQGEVVHTTGRRVLRVVRRRGGRGELRGRDPAAAHRSPPQARVRAPGADRAARGRGDGDRGRLRGPRRARGRARGRDRRGRRDPRDGVDRVGRGDPVRVRAGARGLAEGARRARARGRDRLAGSEPGLVGPISPPERIRA